MFRFQIQNINIFKILPILAFIFFAGGWAPKKRGKFSKILYFENNE